MENCADSIVRYRLPDTDVIHTVTGRIADYTPDTAEGFVVSTFKGRVFVIQPCNGSVDSSYYCEKQDDIPEYSSRFDIFKQALHSGAFHKLVLAHPFCENNIDEKILFEQLLDRYPKAFVYWLSSPITGTWVGASPETLLEVKDGIAHTMALAATTTIGETWDDKSIQEQAYVADYIASELASQGIVYTKSEIHTVHTGHLQHLCTDFQFSIHNSQFSIARTLHPTPAVCGLPKREAQNFILEHEGFDRRLYAGFLGPVNSNEAHLFVNIRCAEIHRDNLATIYAGGGLLAASCLEDEWLELNRKRNNIK